MAALLVDLLIGEVGLLEDNLTMVDEHWDQREVDLRKPRGGQAHKGQREWESYAVQFPGEEKTKNGGEGRR